MDSGCLGNRVSLQVPATTSGGPSGDTWEGVSLSRALKESSTNLGDRKECLCGCPEIDECYIYICSMYISGNVYNGDSDQ